MKIQWNIETGYVNCIPNWEFEIDDEELQDMSETERYEYIDELVAQEFWNHCGVWGDVVR